MAHQIVRVGPALGSEVLDLVINSVLSSGPAPLGVKLDALDSTHETLNHVGILRDVGFYWTFGETGLGDWAYNGESKNIERGGPQAAHVYLDSGTYTIKCRGRDRSGGHGQNQIAVVVEDPDFWFSAANGGETICISQNSDHTGAPAGATLISNATGWGSILPLQDDTRYMLHGGQDFRSWGTLDWRKSSGASAAGVTGSHLTTYSTGGRARIAMLFLDGTIAGGISTTCAFYGIQLQEVGSWPDTRLDNFLFHDCVMDGDFGRITLARPRGLIVSECYVDMHYVNGSDNNCNIFIGSVRDFALIGTSLLRPAEHHVRLSQYARFFAAHNYTPCRVFSDEHTIENPMPSQIRVAYKLNASGINENQDIDVWSGSDPPEDRPCSRWAQITSCYIGSNNTNNNWLGGWGPQNTDEVEGVADNIIENCLHEHSMLIDSNTGELSWSQDWHGGGRDGIARGCINVNDGGPAVIPNDLLEYAQLPPEWNGPYHMLDTQVTFEEPV